MKKFFLMSFLFVNFSLFLFANENSISLDEIFRKIDREENNYETNKYFNRNESLENLIKSNKLGDFNGLEFSSNFYANENYITDRTRKYDKTLQNKLSYGPFYLNYNYMENKNNYISYGIEKNVKDLFYSNHRSNLVINNINKNLNEIEYLKNLEERKLNFLDLYKNILDSQNELLYRKKAKQYYESELKKVKQLYDLGMEARISLEAAEVELEDIKIKIEILEKNLESFYEIAKNEYEINLKNYSLKEIEYLKDDIQENINNYMVLDIKNIELNLEILKEKVKYEKYNSYMPDLIFGYERIDKTERYGRTYKDENIFSVKFSKKLFSTNTEYKNLKIEEKNLINDLEKKKENIRSEKIKLFANYEDLKKTTQISEKKLEIAKKRYEIKRKENELSRVSYLDVIDSYNKYLAQEIETKKVKNEYHAFMYKLLIKASYGGKE